MYEWSMGSAINNAGVNSRLYSQYLVVKQILDYCLEHQIKHVFFGGDWFHTFNTISAITLHWSIKSLQLLTDNQIQVYINDGNHDHATRSGQYTSLTAFERPYCYVSQDRSFDVGVLKVKMIGYKENRDALLMNIEHEHIDMLFLHQGVSGEPMPSGFVIPDEILKPNDIPSNTICWTGHYHNHKQITPNLTIIGSPLQLVWSDTSQTRGWIDYNTDTGEMLHIESVAPKFLNNPDPSVDVKGHFVRVPPGVEVDKSAAFVQVLTEEEVPVTIHSLELPTDLSPVALTRKYAEHAKLNDNLTAIGIALAEGNYAPRYTGD
jgi:DNA repair exonuclease SbcCD nuclease subunit